MSSAAVIDSTKPTQQPNSPSDAEQSNRMLSQLLDAGKFAQYHLEKAKAAFAAGNLSEAQYQTAASLSHERTQEATELRAEIKRRAKAG